jgi:hypothetical protein
MIDHELRRKLGEIIKEAMVCDGVLPKRAWNPNSKTVGWLKDRGFNMGHKTSRKGRHDRWGAWSMAYGTQTPSRGQMEGFVETRISWHNSNWPRRSLHDESMVAWVFVPEDMVEKILVLGCP